MNQTSWVKKLLYGLNDSFMEAVWHYPQVKYDAFFFGVTPFVKPPFFFRSVTQCEKKKKKKDPRSGRKKRPSSYNNIYMARVSNGKEADTYGLTIECLGEACAPRKKKKKDLVLNVDLLRTIRKQYKQNEKLSFKVNLFCIFFFWF